MDAKNTLTNEDGFYSDIAVIGAGAAGMMAAGYATELGASVTLYEKNEWRCYKTRISTFLFY